MFLLATLLAVAALALGIGAGLHLGARRRRESARQPTASVPFAAQPDEPAFAPQRLAALVVDALGQGVVVLDRDERALLVNPAARAMDILASDRLAFPEVTALARQVLATRDVVQGSVDLPIGRLGREPIALAVHAVPLLSGPDDRVAAVALLLADESEQRRLEAVRRDFVANVSHELKTPVGALTLLAEAIEDAADDPAAVARFAGRIQHEGARLARLVGELMELSRVQGADPMPGAAEVDVQAVVSEALQRTEFAAEQASIVVAAACHPGLRVRGDEAQLGTALANLIDNAIAYSASGSRVAVTARAATDEDGRPVVDLAVTDQGIGIAEADQDRIFERFYRVDPARSRATGGTGLGLAIVKNIVNNHSGAVSVWSSPGAGSTFTIRLPGVQVRQPSSAPSYRPDAPQPAKHIAGVGAVADLTATGRAEGCE